MSSCASWHKSDVENPWDRKSNLSTKPLFCKANMQLYFEGAGEDLHGHALLNFHWDKQASQMDLRFLSPFHSTVAELKISKTESFWRTSDGIAEVSSHPIFKKWYSPTWWQEVGFLFGLLSADSGKLSTMNFRQQPASFQSGKRKIKCRYSDASEPFRKVCTLEDQGLSMKFDFSSADCRSTL